MKTRKVNGVKNFMGFTLIELLVVIAIISLLVSILLPSLNKAKDLARNVTCATQQRNLGLGIQLFAAENNAYLPQQKDGVVAEDSQWGQQILPYVGGIEMFFCPSHEGYISNPKLSVWSDINYYRIFGFPNASSYGYNYFYLGCETSEWGNRKVRVNLGEVVNHSDTIVSADSCQNQFMKWSAILIPGQHGFSQWGGLWSYARHSVNSNGNANFMMLDGHIETCEANADGTGIGSKFGDLDFWDIE